MTEHSKHYWENSRNGWEYTTTLDDFSEKEVVSENEYIGSEDEKQDKSYTEEMDNDPYYNIPEYYKGKNGYMARKVVDNFDLSYNIGTAVTYLLRAYRKHESPAECIRKAIDHLNFELEKLDE